MAALGELGHDGAAQNAEPAGYDDNAHEILLMLNCFQCILVEYPNL
jgi:hypothetical protein